MAEKSIAGMLRETFSDASTNDWKLAASQEIEGKDPFLALAWKNADQLTFAAYHDKTDVATSAYLKKFQIPPAQHSYQNPRQWASLVPVHVTNAATANRIALEHLNQGADGILFDLRSETSYNLQQLLHNINWSYCTLSFRIANPATAKLIHQYLAEQKYDADTVHGLILHDNSDHILYHEKSVLVQNNFKSYGLHIQGSTPTDEIVQALLGGVMVADQQTENISYEHLIRQIAFSLPADNFFLQNIAKFKAMRMLWYQIVRAYGIQIDFDEIKIHARSEPWTSEAYQPHGNMLKATYAALSAVAGGCDSLTILPEDENNTTMYRVARNISSVLREESHLDKVADPFAGSYSIDALTNDIAAAAWKKFQTAVEKLKKP